METSEWSEDYQGREADELALFIENDADLYRQQTEPIIKNLQKKFKKGIYNENLAVKLWTYLANNGAKSYAKQFTKQGDWNRMFTPETRRKAAQILEKKYKEDVENG